MTLPALAREAVEHHLGGGGGRRRLLTAAAGRSGCDDIAARYRDLPLGGVDASVLAAAELLDIGEIATLDLRQPRRHETRPQGSSHPSAT